MIKAKKTMYKVENALANIIMPPNGVSGRLTTMEGRVAGEILGVKAWLYRLVENVKLKTNTKVNSLFLQNYSTCWKNAVIHWWLRMSFVVILKADRNLCRP